MALPAAVHEPTGNGEDLPLRAGDTNLADVTERLLAEFENQLDLKVISDVVLHARHQLAGAPATALPELVERSARQRLLDLQGEDTPHTVMVPD